jgi:hypothetical protein
VFEEFHIWLDAHPNEVVTIFAARVSGDIPITYVDGLLDKHHLKPLLHHHDQGKPWATLGEMIKSKKRLVVFSGAVHGDILDAEPYSVSMSSGWQSKWKTADVINDCGSLTATQLGGEALSEVNHKLTMSIARLRDPHFNTKALQQHLFNCFSKYKKAPTFLWVDYYKSSWAMKMANDANSNAIKKP